MRIGVGSENPVKRRAVESVVEGFLPDPTVDAVSVESGVADQPTGHPETVVGAETRARNVLADGGYDLAVGIEGGVAEFDGTNGLFLVMWAVAADGDRTGHGAGPAIPLPERVAARLREGAELGAVMDDLLGEDGVARKQGAAGALTAGHVDREEALASAVAGALGPFVTDLY